MRNVIIVDDDPNLLKALGGLLRSYEYAVQLFASADEFLRYANLTDAICLILDINLAGMSGIELRRLLSQKGLDIPVIFMTADDRESLRNEAREAGCIACYEKPVAVDLLMNSINVLSQSGNISQ
jgi:FixJ family two-component response regulator